MTGKGRHVDDDTWASFLHFWHAQSCQVTGRFQVDLHQLSPLVRRKLNHSKSKNSLRSEPWFITTSKGSNVSTMGLVAALLTSMSMPPWCWTVALTSSTRWSSLPTWHGTPVMLNQWERESKRTWNHVLRKPFHLVNPCSWKRAKASATRWADLPQIITLQPSLASCFAIPKPILKKESIISIIKIKFIVTLLPPAPASNNGNPRGRGWRRAHGSSQGLHGLLWESMYDHDYALSQTDPNIRLLSVFCMHIGRDLNIKKLLTLSHG